MNWYDKTKLADNPIQRVPVRRARPVPNIIQPNAIPPGQQTGIMKQPNPMQQGIQQWRSLSPDQQNAQLLQLPEGQQQAMKAWLNRSQLTHPQPAALPPGGGPIQPSPPGHAPLMNGGGGGMVPYQGGAGGQAGGPLMPYQPDTVNIPNAAPQQGGAMTVWDQNMYNGKGGYRQMDAGGGSVGGGQQNNGKMSVWNDFLRGVRNGKLLGKCQRCGGRIMSAFNYCPNCGMSLGHENLTNPPKKF